MSKKIKKQGSKLPNIQVRRKETKTEAASVGGSTTYYVHGPQGIHAQQAEGEWKWMVQDGLGSVRSIVDNAVAVQESLGYSPDGKPINGVGSPQTMYGFTGEPTDPNGLVHLRERYYSPDLGAFISQDPFEGTINEAMSLNRYAYAHGNPVNMTDPSGMFPAQALNNMMQSNPLAFVQMMNAGMCFAKQSTTDCETLRHQVPQPSIRELLLNGCIPFEPIQPGQEVLPGTTPTPGGLRLPVDNGRLSNCDLTIRPETGLPSRDVNIAVPAPVAVYAPANGEVMIVDATGDNAGLGNFVAIRIHTSQLPPEVASRLGGSGYVYIGYAHLSQVLVQAVGNAPYTPVTAGQQVGVTGSTGTDNIHLDVTVFFIPDNPSGPAPAPFSTGRQEIVDGSVIPAHEYFQSFYSLGRTEAYSPRIIDPLLLWPELAQGTICAVG